MSTAPSPMDLTDVLSMLEERRQEPTEGTQRRFKRFPVRGDARLEPVEPESLDRGCTVLLRDISRGGIGFLCDHAIEPGALFRVQFQADGHEYGAVPITVCFCRLVQDDLYMVGGQFIVEPYIMSMMGVSPAELAGESLGRFDPLDVSDFIDPETELGG